MDKISPSDEARARAQRGTRQFLIARLCLVGSSFVIAAILARQLGPAAFGIYGVIISQLLWLEMLANAGVPGAIAKLMADGRYEHKAIESSARALLLGFSLVLFVLSWLAAPWVAQVMRIPDGAALMRIAIIDLPFMAFFASYDGILNGRRQFGALALAQVIGSLAKVAGVVALFALGFSIDRVLVVIVVSTCAACLVLSWRFPPRGFRPSGRIVREIAGITAPVGLYLISGQVLLNLDLWLLKGLWEGNGDVLGYYVASMNLAKVLLVIPGAQAWVIFSSVAWAVAARDMERARRHIQDATRFAVIIAAAAWVILGLNAGEILALLYSRPYGEGGLFLPLQLAGLGLFALLDAFSHSLMAGGRQGLPVGAVIATIPIIAISNYILIPWIGPLGAAVSMILGVSIACLLMGTMAYRDFGSLARASTLGRVLCAAATVALASVLSPISGPLVLIKLAFLGGIYLVVLFMLGEITRKDFVLLGVSRAEHPA